jgi:hypothetical protein
MNIKTKEFALNHLYQIKISLEKAGAMLPIEIQGTIESSITTGLSIAYLVVLEHIEIIEKGEKP